MVKVVSIVTVPGGVTVTVPEGSFKISLEIADRVFVSFVMSSRLHVSKITTIPIVRPVRK